MTFRAHISLLSLAALCTWACGSSSPTSTNTADELTITLSDNPVSAAPSPDPAYQYSATVVLTLAETKGLAVTIDAVNGRLDQASGGIVVVTPTAPVYRFQARGTGNKVPPRSSLPVTADFLYTIGDGSREALLTVTFQLYDDAGNVYPQSTQIKVI
jgi:hypothetical protein